MALATQDVARSFLGGLTILADRPFEIGDTIETNALTGTVEDITFRTTRLRDINNQIVIIPNSRMMDSFIINTSKKEQRRFNLPLTIKSDTPLEKITVLEKKLRSALESQEDIIQESIRVTLNNIASTKIEVLINFYTEITESEDYALFKEQMNFTILEIINQEEIVLA
ncbi:MAG: mechanosensitive ion channel family protein [Oscillospiraceae bacterium]|nr:mechanosensitive ion channel family protein [Oscillospiraceae bacterium]